MQQTNNDLLTAPTTTCEPSCWDQSYNVWLQDLEDQHFISRGRDR
jgi:hypothetical protein